MSQPTLLHYRPWRGEFREPLLSVWSVARVGLRMMFRYWPFWIIYGLGLLIFLFFFFAQYFLAWADAQAGSNVVQMGGFGFLAHDILRNLRELFHLGGHAVTYLNFFAYQSYVILVVLALAGSMLVGNDIRHGSLTFYLSKPISRWHYLLGKCLASAVFINMLTTLPALLLFVEWSFLDGWSYVSENGRLCLGILGYGLVLTVTFSLLMVTIACWMRTTVPIIMTWATVFLFPKLISSMLVDTMRFDVRFRLIDLWNDAWLVGNWLLDIGQDQLPSQNQPEFKEAAAVLAGVCVLCVLSLVRRIRAVEIIK